MAEQNIPAEMLDAVFEAVGKRLFPTNWHFVLSSPSCREYADTRWLAYHALEAAGVPDLVRQNCRLKKELLEAHVRLGQFEKEKEAK